VDVSKGQRGECTKTLTSKCDYRTINSTRWAKEVATATQLVMVKARATHLLKPHGRIAKFNMKQSL